jgi:TonB family protein
VRRYLIWSVVLHVVVVLGGTISAPLSGLVPPSRPPLVITVGLVDMPEGKKGPMAAYQPPKIVVATPEPVKAPPEPLKAKDTTKTKAADKTKADTTRRRPEPALAQADSGGIAGTVSEGSGGGGGDIWGVETGAGVNPYHRQGFAAIRANWRNPILGHTPRRCVVRFVVKSSGEITDIELEQPSGSELFDRAALRAVRVTHTWSRFPASWEEDEQIVHLEFEYRP